MQADIKDILVLFHYAGTSAFHDAGTTVMLVGYVADG
jgi:hypothetical protein